MWYGVRDLETRSDSGLFLSELVVLLRKELSERFERWPTIWLFHFLGVSLFFLDLVFVSF